MPVKIQIVAVQLSQFEVLESTQSTLFKSLPIEYLCIPGGIRFCGRGAGLFSVRI